MTNHQLVRPITFDPHGTVVEGIVHAVRTDDRDLKTRCGEYIHWGAWRGCKGWAHVGRNYGICREAME